MFPHRYWYLRYWKHRKKPCVLVLIAPHSPRQWWYPILLELLVDIPRKLHGRCWHKGMQYKIYQSRVSKSGKWKFQVWFQKEKVHLESPGLYQAGKENLNRQRRYLTRLVIYRSWCDRRHNSPYSASVDDLANNFFVYLHEERGCKTNTAAGYITAIATIYAGWRGRSVNSNADLLSLM